MGYDLYIQRGEAADDALPSIPDRALIALAASEPDLEWTRQDGARALVWTRPDGERWPLWWAEGYLYCASLDGRVLDRLVSIADALDAAVFDDDGRRWSGLPSAEDPALAGLLRVDGASGRARPGVAELLVEAQRDEVGDEVEDEWARRVGRERWTRGLALMVAFVAVPVGFAGVGHPGFGLFVGWLLGLVLIVYVSPVVAWLWGRWRPSRGGAGASAAQGLFLLGGWGLLTVGWVLASLWLEA